ncbi:MAG: hypothetical protein L3K26_18330 [Candidatus Hydrogenedentes bacterium]|nr:hypothetical protein [Candidatus Hydrogenedentota bacterium]
MNRGKSIDRIASTAPLALALVLPMGAFALVPLLNLSLITILLLLMAGLTLRVWHHERLQRPPFEYWWPIALLLPASAVALLRDEGPFSIYLLQSILAFLGALALASNGTVACRAITVFGAATGVNALMHWGTEFSWLPPTVIFAPANVLLAGPTTLSSGIMLTLGGILANVVVLIHPRFSPRQRRITVIPLLALSSFIFFLFLPCAQAVLSTWIPCAFHRLPTLSLFLMLIALWIPARIAARSLLCAVHQKEARLAVIPAAIGSLVIIHLVAGAAPPIAAVFLLGLVAALDAPWTEHRPSPLSFPTWAFPVLCIILQVLGLFPLSSADLRNQSARGERLLESAQWNELNGMLTCLLDRQPGHPDYNLLQARALLAQGWPAASVEAYRAINLPKTTIAPPFQSRNRRAFLDDLRDTTSAQAHGHAHFLFEQALAHDNEVDQVRNLLQIRRGRAKALEGAATDVETLKRGLATLLGAPALTLQSEDWDARALLGILSDAGIDVVKLPGDFVKNIGPILLNARLGPDGLYIETAFLNTGRREAFHQYLAPPATLRIDVPKLAWGSFGRTLEGPWEIELFAADIPVATLRIDRVVTMAFYTEMAPANAELTVATLYVP